MPDRFPSIFLVAGAAILFLLLWVASIVYVYLHSRQRPLDDQRRMTWVAVATLLPLVGLVAYLVLGGLSRPAQNHLAERPRQGGRATLYQAQGGPPQAAPGQGPVRMDTIAGFDLLKGTKPGSPPPPFKSPFYKSRPFRSPAQQSPQSAPSTAPPPQLVPVFQIIALSGPYKGQKYLLEELPARIGRGSWATIHLDQDLSISRQHAEITRQEGAYFLRDLNSSHGTRLNGQTVKETTLSAGDRLELGSSEFLVQAVERRAG